MKEASSIGQISLGFEPPYVQVPDLWNVLQTTTGTDSARQLSEDKSNNEELLDELVKFDLIKNSDEKAQENFKVKITSFTSSGVELEAYFSQPLLVSQGTQGLDQIEISL